jgi:type II secretory pathway pseudopilin PulG
MEMLVVLAIFATISVAVTDIFLLSTKAQRRIGAAERTQGDARSALEYLVRTVRTGTIAYDLLPNPLPSPLTSIALRNGGGTLFQFSLSSDAVLCGASAVPCLLVTEGETAPVTAPLTGADVALKDLRFFLSPETDPFSFDQNTGAYATDAQPLLTISMTVSPPGKTAQQTVVQTSVTPRSYAR